MALNVAQLCKTFIRTSPRSGAILASFVSKRNLSVKAANDSLQVDWQDGSAVSSYPYIFLRDNCQCEQCFHATAKQRLIDTALSVPVDIRPESVCEGEEKVNLKWEDGHCSSFHHKWLQERKFPNTDAEVVSRSKCGLVPKIWGSELSGKIPSYDYETIMNNDDAFLSWQETVAVTGIALVENTPSRVIYSDLCNKLFCPTRSTHYGEMFTVMNKPGANNLAYTAGYLPLHVDLPFYKHQPGIQLLHCIKQASGEGGENHYVDGFQIAEQLRENSPEVFRILSTVKFTFEDVGTDKYGEFRKLFERPVIGLDMFGNVDNIAHNNHVRSSFINAPPEKVKKLYDAYYKLVKAMYDEANLVTYKMKAGDIVAFNNQRVLHGRAAYKATTARHLSGCYFDWDEFYSAIRVYRKKLGLE